MVATFMIGSFMIEKIKQLLFGREEGQGMIEYGLIIALISIAVIAVLVLFGPALADIFNKALAGLKGAAAP